MAEKVKAFLWGLSQGFVPKEDDFVSSAARIKRAGFDGIENVKCAVNPEVGRERFIPEYYPPV